MATDVSVMATPGVARIEGSGTSSGAYVLGVSIFIFALR